MNQYIIPILVFVAVLCLGVAVVVLLRARRGFVAVRLNAAQTVAASGQPSGAHGVVSAFGAMALPREPSRGLRDYLASAGFHHHSAAATYMGIKVLLMIIGLCIGALVVLTFTLSASIQFLLIVGIPLTLFIVPNFFVLARRRSRRAEIRRHLPDIIDLLEICVSAGMGLDMAWNSVNDEIRNVSPTMADEMALTMLESHLGAPRTVAMRHMAQRTGAVELASLVALLVQSERFGTSIGDALRLFANSMRDDRSQRAEEAAEKNAVKLLIPLVFCIFPVMLIVSVGPAVLRLYEMVTASP